MIDLKMCQSAGAAPTSFVSKLYELVSNGPDEVVGFVDDGSAFEVRDPRRLETEILPKYFRHSRFQSLVRQLNFYSFKKVSKERSVCIYQHALFQRDHPDKLEHLKRKTSNGDKFRARGSRKEHGGARGGGAGRGAHGKRGPGRGGGGLAGLARVSSSSDMP